MISKRALNKGPQSFKVHIRRLPPLLREEEFYATIQEYLNDIVMKYYVKGKLKEQEKIDSRCYLFFNCDAAMSRFIQGYKKVFCDEKGIYYQPDIGKALLQNQQDHLRNKPKPLEGEYQKTELYKRFLKFLEEEQLQQQEMENAQTQQLKEEPINPEDKPKKFEKVKTHIIMELEKEYQKKKELKTQIDNLTTTKNIIKLKCEEDGRIIERTFIFVPKAKN
ncbi:unnamed protein product (macronuclear) [Paramecium tetraurelia]|uniref:UPF3 domain-containing protein n=1 Tax=Paramecium tetraurelia TaxID=5888 RepID=A0CWM3_PARTE|nr:uncharacterized protein GSPATT00001393001 [Paramecium tetraurelia]CAK75190.1 unnamed protein product [Paramecium tetraurelia]|eukprot:XP_001442587.1 hypothetical protein (macronuclear) [Paramecium tetraurelia strain d4-2]